MGKKNLLLLNSIQRMENERKISIPKVLSSQKGSPSQKIDTIIDYSLKLICSLFFTGWYLIHSLIYILSRVNFLCF